MRLYITQTGEYAEDQGASADADRATRQSRSQSSLSPPDGASVPCAFERIVEFYPAHDDFDPVKRTGSRNFMRIKFILKGPLGATQFMVGTTWGLPQSDASTERLLASDAVNACRPTGYDVGYHSPKPLYEGQTPMECDLMPEGRCYYDGSGLRADDWVPGFIEGGSDWVWQKLEEEYRDLFASAGEAGTATTPQSGVVHEHATAEGGDAQTQSGESRE